MSEDTLTRLYALLDAAGAAGLGPAAGPHVSDEALAARLAGTLTEDEYARFQRHLRWCVDCLRRFEEVRRLVPDCDRDVLARFHVTQMLPRRGVETLALAAADRGEPPVETRFETNSIAVLLQVVNGRVNAIVTRDNEPLANVVVMLSVEDALGAEVQIRGWARTSRLGQVDLGPLMELEPVNPDERWVLAVRRQ